jgi:hypothetical protein
MKYISIGVSCRVSYSAIDCLQEPHGGIGAGCIGVGSGNSHFKIFASG